MTQLGQQPRPVAQAVLSPARVPAGEGDGVAAGESSGWPTGRGAPVRVEPGTLMEKIIPHNLVEPYLTGQRSVISGYAYRAADAAQAGPAWPAQARGRRAAESTVDSPDFWVLRWRSLEMQIYLAPPVPPDHPRRQTAPGLPALDMFIEPCPVPVGTEMYRITPAREEFIARHDGQAWLRPAPEA
ncbi:MAG TPA: hypothetical protein VKS82_13335 [Streptosporangiaceae bacterium]|nr:hypothetical protein [Streptosporangiaceae bacterium]